MTRRIKLATGRALLLFVCLAIPIAWAAAQHGGKAEGRRVRFDRGKTMATYKGQVRGSTEIEYELTAQMGQELIVRVVSDPPNSAFVKILRPNSEALETSCLSASSEISKQLGLASEASCFVSDPQKMRRDGHTWSNDLPDSGAYTLSVFRPNAGSGVSTYTLTIIVRPRDQETESALRTDAASLDAAMRNFIAALRKRDVEGFLSLFSRKNFFYANNPLNAMRVAVPYSELAADVRKKGDWYYTYLERGEGGTYDAFVDHIADAEPWPRVEGVKFVPPGSGISASSYVKWRREGGKWVIYEISYAQA